VAAVRYSALDGYLAPQPCGTRRISVSPTGDHGVDPRLQAGDPRSQWGRPPAHGRARSTRARLPVPRSGRVIGQDHA
jgi:hypothetical protein